jgi:peptidoglycan L-alanyl-D-glutamate endopeptidase CwlK
VKKENWYIIGAVAVSVATLGIIAYSNRKKIVELNSQVMDFVENKVWDAVSEAKILTLHPKIRDKAREFLVKAEKAGYKLRITSGLRTYAEQNALYAKGRTTAGSIVTNAKGGQSNHNFGTAIDVVPIVNGKADWNSKDWNKIGELGKSIGFAWGGDFKNLVDKPHFEMQFGLTLAQLRKKYESGDKQGEYINIS